MAAPKRKTYTDRQKRIVAALRECAKDLGYSVNVIRPPGASSVEAPGQALSVEDYLSWSRGRAAKGQPQPTLREINQAYGGWRFACADAEMGTVPGIPPLHSLAQVERSFEVVKTLLKDELEQEGHFPGLSLARYAALREQHPKLELVPFNSIRRYFTWTQACEHFGLAPACVRSVREMEGRLELVYRVCVEAGGPLSVRLFDLARPSGCPTAQKIARAEGCGWSEVLVRAGFPEAQVTANRRARIYHQDRELVAA